MYPHPATINYNRGFSLVEIMVGMVISLLSMIIILQVFSTFEGQKRTSSSGSDAQTAGAVSLFTIERDVRNAGYGFADPTMLGCKINMSYNGTLIPGVTLAPVTVTNGLNGMPDTIAMVASGKNNFSIPARITTDHPATATNFFINSTLGMQVNDLMVAYEPGKDCTVFQITGIPNGNVQIHHQSTSLWNPPGGQNIFPASGYSPNAMLLNFGQMINHTYSVDAQSNLLFTDYSSASNVTVTQPLVPDIVNMQAQYGFDTRAGTQTDARVDTWSDTMIDADGNGTVGNSSDIGRIYAIRLSLVARSGQMEKVNAGTLACDTTNANPTWAGGSIKVDINPDGTANPNWRCYRYKTFETVIPLRNLIWRQ